MKELSLRERIAMGECVSPLTADRCPVCIDCCEAFHWKRNLKSDLQDLKINLPADEKDNDNPNRKPDQKE